MRGHIVVLDIGKTMSRASLWAPGAVLQARLERPNAVAEGPAYRTLDDAGIECFIESALRDFAQHAPVSDIIPVAHGAGIVVVSGDRPSLPPMDYEQAIPQALRQAYALQRDPFAPTGSPLLPDGLNLGSQLHFLESLYPEAFGSDTMLLPWAQYWAWRLCGVAASEVTSLGCHSDLWLPALHKPSPLARRRGWASRLAPLRRAGDALGCLLPEWAARTGLPGDVQVRAGLHDSNAALWALRGSPELQGRELTVLSTGTWFIAMRATPEAVDMKSLPGARDCLVNVDVEGRAVPSARFMGGREIELLSGGGEARIDLAADQPAILAALPRVLASGSLVLPGFVPGCGPFPQSQGRWINVPTDSDARRASIALYAALMVDASLDLIGAKEQLVIEGRFAVADCFTRVLASLRPDMAVFAAGVQNDVSFGALRILDPSLLPRGRLSKVEPLAVDLQTVRRSWRVAASEAENKS